MGSFFGFGNYDKPGKGVRKDAPTKNRFFLFFELYFRNFWKLVWLNILYMIACIPLVTFGPATTALMKLTSDLVERKPVFIWHDFWTTFRKNFFQSLVWGVLELIMLLACVYSIIFFAINLDKANNFVTFGLVIAIVFLFVIVFTFFHSWLLSAKVELKTFAMLKNSLILSAMSLKSNIVILLFLVVFGFLFYLLFPVGLVFLPFFPMATLGFLISYLYFPYVYMYIIKPYYEQSGDEDPYAPKEEEEYEYEYVYEDENGNVIEVAKDEKPETAIFSDAPELEDKSQIGDKKSTQKKSIR